MFPRLSRIRFILIRSFFLSFIILLFLQILTYFKHENTSSPNRSNQVLKNEKQLAEEDENLLSDDQRIKEIELIKNQYEKDELNWTKIFYENYYRKLIKMKERDEKTTLKYHFNENQANIFQEKFQIYEQTLVFGNPKFCTSDRIFHPQCPYSNCQWTCKKPSVNSENHRRAHIFHHVDVKADEMSEKLQYRSSKDIWILWIDEANRDIQHLNQYKFNWTLSFRQDSEISFGSYGILTERTKRESTKPSSNNYHPDFRQILKDANIKTNNLALEYRIFTNHRYRHKHALWFVSNCGPQRRLEYYNKLKTYYPIKAFGSCVENKCDRDSYCEHEQSQLALFYLAFESQTCTDYITEKFWRALYYGMIPIVLGPSKQSYLDLGVPETAFIHIDDFQSENELANYLNKISKNYLLYRKYFQWLNQYEPFYDINVLEPIRMCELCMKLNLQDYNHHSYYINLHDWHRTAC